MYHRAGFYGRPSDLISLVFLSLRIGCLPAPLHFHTMAVRLRLLTRLRAMATHYDVIIIGTGPGGGTLAYKLAPSGKKILGGFKFQVQRVNDDTAA